MKKLGVVLPWDSPFIWRHSVENMMNWKRPVGVVVNYFFGKGWCPANRHNNGVQAALDWGADLIVFAGSDHVVEREYLVKLWNNIYVDGWDMASGIITGRTAPFEYLAYQALTDAMPNFNVVRMAQSIRFWKTLSKKDGSQEIHCIGTGCLAVKKEVFEKMERPWFRECVNEDDKNFARVPVNDTEFVARATLDYDFRLWLNTDIDCRHLEIFAIDETFRDRFNDKEQYWSPTRSVLNEPQF